MAILGIFTNSGIAGAQQAQLDQGFKIFPTDFGVTDVQDPLLPSISAPNAGQWYQGPISSRVVVDYNTIKFICTVPPGAAPPLTTRTVRQVYLYARDSLNNPFILAVGNPSSDILYDPTGTVTLQLELSLTNADLSSIIVFQYTQATEISEHNTSPNAHDEFQRALAKHGIYPVDGAGVYPFEYRGQTIDEKPVWEGTKGTAVYGSVTWTATHTGPDSALISLNFDGVKTTDDVRQEWNNANPYNTVEHNGTGNEVFAAATVVLTAGTLQVADRDIVYKDVDGKYKKALADGTIKSNVAGWADLSAPSKRIVRQIGFSKFTAHGLTIGTKFYLSDSVPGAITNSPTIIQLGFVQDADTLLFGTAGGSGSGGGGGEGYDAIVTDIVGPSRYPTTDLAIAATPDGGKILVDKLEQVQSTIVIPNTKRLDFHFNGPEAGWTRYLGTAEQQKISFTSVPTSGTWRIEWNGNETTDLAFNATALDVQNAINALPAHPALPVVVTGNYTSGFVLVFQDFQNAVEPTFTNTGVNEIQHLTFSQVPDDGTIRLNFNGQFTANFAWNDDATLLETYLEALTNINNVQVSGNFTTGFIIEWIGVDGKQNQPLITIDNNSLTRLLAPVTANVATTQGGKFPSQNLKTGVASVGISVQTLVGGTALGPTTGLVVGKDGTRFLGKGKVRNFPIGIDLNGRSRIEIDLTFENTVTPYIVGSLKQGLNYNAQNSFGLSTQKFLTVGVFGDFPDLWTAVAAATNGDKIIVYEDQVISSNQIIDKDIEIIFANRTKMSVNTVFTGNVLSLGTRVRTRYAILEFAVSGPFDVGVNMFGSRGNHEDLTIVLSDAGTTLTTAFEIESGASGIYCDGVITRGLATVTNGLLNSSGTSGHNVIIRDQEGGLVYDVQDRQPFLQEVPTGLIDGLNNTFQLSQVVGNPQALVVYVDGLARTQGIDYGLSITNNQVIFNPGHIPQVGQTILAAYFPSGIVNTPSRQMAVYNGVIQAMAGVTELVMGPSLVASPLGPRRVQIDQASGASSWRVYVHTVTALEEVNKQFMLTTQPQDPTKVMVDSLQYGSKEYSVDYNISPLGLFSWNALGLDGLLVAGDKIRFAYYG